ncbi:hypothetical protein R4J09_08390 [Brachyspira intermedia]|uniref:hypothetical protein n=1 Tax=Brachyspira intermedia TaxID=84377 RepID=UPI003004C147
MKELLSDIDLSSIEIKNYYSIFERENSENEKYWVISNETDCTLCSTSSVGKNLTDFEWENNEIYISNSLNVKEVINLALKMFMSLKNILEENYSYQIFDLILTLSDGSNEVPPNANIRFYAVRDNFRIVDLEDIGDNKSEAVLIETVNQN